MGILIGLQWTVIRFQIFLFIAELALLIAFIRIDTFRYRNLDRWRKKLYLIQDQIIQYFKTGEIGKDFKIDTIDQFPYDFEKNWCNATARRLYRVYLSIFIIIYLNTCHCTLINNIITPQNNVILDLSIVIIRFFFKIL